MYIVCFFFNDTATTEIYTYFPTLSLPDALPIYPVAAAAGRARRTRHRLRRGRGDGRPRPPARRGSQPRRTGPARFRPVAPGRAARAAAHDPAPAARRLRPGTARRPQPPPARDRGDARLRPPRSRVRAVAAGLVAGAGPRRPG